MRRGHELRPAEAVLARRSPVVARLFAGWLESYVARHFAAMRLAGPPPADRPGPLLVIANHPSWWDPLHMLILAARLLPDRQVFGPMDQAALARYRLLERVGVFGVEQGTRAGAAAFLRTGRAVLRAPGASLWVTGQGRFTDPRQRPVRLAPGSAHLARSLGAGRVLPLALEYPFWNESRPEMLARFGAPVIIERERGLGVDAWTRLLETRLTAAQDALAQDARERDPSRFRTLVRGRTGVGGVYDLGRRVRAWSRGRRFIPAHEGRRP